METQMAKKRVRVPVEKKDEIETRLAGGESLRSIARSFGTTYQALQYHRSLWGSAPLRASDVRGAAHPNWRGGSSIDKWGYRLLYTPERHKSHPYSYEHVLVAEKMIGRRLAKGEHVHHLNGVKLDNRPENLLVCTASEHRILHRQLEALAMELLQAGHIEYRNGRYGWARAAA
jgi:hypothetical protein